jgi:hypothetical protein
VALGHLGLVTPVIYGESSAVEQRICGGLKLEHIDLWT